MSERRVIAAALVVIAATMVVNTIGRTERIAEAQIVTGPVEPTVVAGHVIAFSGSAIRDVWRFWSDGAVDATRATGVGCTGVPDVCGTFQILPGSCASDITRNGSVEFQDLLGVLNDWGPCPQSP